MITIDEKLFDECLAPFKIVEEMVFKTENLIQSHRRFKTFIGSNGKGIIMNTLINIDSEYYKQLKLLCKKFDVKYEDVKVLPWYDLPERERNKIRIIYWFKPMIAAIEKFMSLITHKDIRYCELEENPFILITAVLQKVYGDSIPYWHKAIKEYETGC